MTTAYQDLHPIANCTYKKHPSHFIVTEQIDPTPCESGEHLWLFIEKINVNTEFVVRLLSKWAKVSVRDVGYSGLKDRHAQTYQWFSIRLPNRHQKSSEDFNQWVKSLIKNDEHICILKSVFCQKKLNRGTHKQNHFDIILNDIKVQNSINLKAAIDKRLHLIKSLGIPNYFGEQRVNEGNIKKTIDLFNNSKKMAKLIKNKHRLDADNAFLLSVAKSVIFNAIVDERVANQTWHTPIDGDVFNLNGTGSVFTAPIDDKIRQRMQMGDIHSTAPLVGMTNKVSATQTALDIEQKVLSCPNFASLVKGATALSAYSSRRPMRVMVENLNHLWLDDATLKLSFSLPKGSFATAVLYQLTDNLR